MLDMTAASKAVEALGEAQFINGYLMGVLATTAIAIIVVSLLGKKAKQSRNEYMKTLTDSEYRKYNEMLKKQKE